MTQLSAQQQQAVHDAVAEALVTETAQIEAKTEGLNPKEVFCENWDTVSRVLAVLMAIVPGPAKGVIGAVLAIGNGVKKAIC